MVLVVEPVSMESEGRMGGSGGSARLTGELALCCGGGRGLGIGTRAELSQVTRAVSELMQ